MRGSCRRGGRPACCADTPLCHGVRGSAASRIGSRSSGPGGSRTSLSQATSGAPSPHHGLRRGRVVVIGGRASAGFAALASPSWRLSSRGPIGDTAASGAPDRRAGAVRGLAMADAVAAASAEAARRRGPLAAAAASTCSPTTLRGRRVSPRWMACGSGGAMTAGVRLVPEPASVRTRACNGIGDGRHSIAGCVLPLSTRGRMVYSASGPGPAEQQRPARMGRAGVSAPRLSAMSS